MSAPIYVYVNMVEASLPGFALNYPKLELNPNSAGAVCAFNYSICAIYYSINI